MPDSEPERRRAAEPVAAAPRRGPTYAAAVLLIALAAVAAWYFLGAPRDVAEAPTASTKGSAPAGGSRRGAGPDPARPTPVATVTARSGTFDVYLNALGTVTPRSTVTVKPRVDGQLMRVLFRGRPDRSRRASCSPRSIRVRSRCSSTQAEGQLARTRRCSRTRASTSSATGRCSSRIRSPSSRSTRRQRWCGSTRARSQADQGAGRQRAAAAHLRARSPRRSAGRARAAPGRRRQHRARGATPTASSSSRSCSRSASIFTIPEDNAAARA